MSNTTIANRTLPHQDAVSETKMKQLNIPMNDLLDMWLETKKICVKPSTLAQYRRIVRKTLKPEFDGLTTRTVSSDTLRAIAESLLNRYSAVTTQMVLTVTNQILQFMCEN